MEKIFDHPDLNNRQLRAQINPATGNPVFYHTLTKSSICDVVDCVVPTLYVLPVIFVPGIMGSNLMNESKKQVWRLDMEESLLASKIMKSAGERQKALHPARTTVDDRGEVPKTQVGILNKEEHFRARYWGEVSKTSYQDFLIWLEEQLNGGGTSSNHKTLNTTLAKVQDGRAAWGARKDFAPLTPEDSKKAVDWYYPVYACGYNWLDDNAIAATRLKGRIDEVIKANNQSNYMCEQVLLVTHSMGGLVARKCSMLPGMQDKIAGVVHGVMPAVGAAVAYRRCKVGMKDEGATGVNMDAAGAWGAALTIGNTGQEVTAVFAQAPGALQLLPTKQYPVQNWLQVCDSAGGLLPEQPMTDDPYESIYKERKKWWGLINEDWLAPKDGQPTTWNQYLKVVDKAALFHDSIQDYYHPNTWGFYGSREPSFEGITWRLEVGTAKPDQHTPTRGQLTKLDRSQVPLKGQNPEAIPVPKEVMWTEYKMPSGSADISYYRLRLATANDSGDGTVPVASGRWPVGPAQPAAVQQCIKQFFEVPGVQHEPAFKHPLTQQLTVYAISKIAAKLALPGKPKA
jgi:hypothetical protein